MKQRDWITVAIFVGILGALVYLLRGKLPLGHGAQPERIAGNTASFDDIYPKAMGEHFVHPSTIRDPVSLPVRYPPRAGHEITTLISYGYTALFQPRGALTTWVDCPPSEVG